MNRRMHWISLPLLALVVIGLLGCDPPVAKKKKPAPDAAPTALTGDPAESPTETVKAEVGVGQQGRSLDEHEGIYVTPAKALFATKERVVFEIQLPQAMQFYKASNGEGPKSHDDFMEKIVKENQIKLPELPPGHKYQYNVETEELEVVRPAKQ